MPGLARREPEPLDRLLIIFSHDLAPGVEIERALAGKIILAHRLAALGGDPQRRLEHPGTSGIALGLDAGEIALGFLDLDIGARLERLAIADLGLRSDELAIAAHVLVGEQLVDLRNRSLGFAGDRRLVDDIGAGRARRREEDRDRRAGEPMHVRGRLRHA